MADLKKKTYNGIVWSSVQRVGVMAITFVSNLVLARLLSPEDFGCVAMLMIFISLSNTFIDGGFGSALIQKKEPTQADYSTIFYWNIILSIVLYAILFFAAPLIANFYRIELLTSVLRVQGAILIFNAFSIIQQNQLKKQLQFKKLAIVNVCSAVVSLILAVIAALNGWGVWSLVVQQISLSLLNAVFFFFATRWVPLRVFSMESFKELFKFGGFMLLSHLFSTLSNEIQGLLVGRMFTPATLGLYSQAYRLEGSAATAASSIIDQVTYPVMASLQDDKQKLISALKRFIQIPAFICSPIMMILIVVAKPLIILLYSEKWVECVPYFQILCTAGLAVCLQGSANNAIAAIGKSRILFRWTIIKRLLTIILCVVGILMAGMYGLLWSCVLGAWAVFFINAYLVEKHIGYTLIKQVLDIAPYAVLAIVIGVMDSVIGNCFELNMYVMALIQVVVGLSLYLGVSYIMKFDSFIYILQTLKERKSK